MDHLENQTCPRKLEQKRSRTEACAPSSSKACREKLRRDKINDRFIELAALLEPGRPPKTDKSAILADAVRMVTQLRGEAQKLKDSNSNLQLWYIYC
ncbi:transcription factor ilr3 [Phtheirospermum japonicum]|uniref:Transcription factor ilr3 n=1 Tax=Phtheirospermum japonicum TaxID=374723 RepID=A0A830B3P7_9LAMI|nr:transcription factor ilr3 [Phtheirospermum japonicum]